MTMTEATALARQHGSTLLRILALLLLVILEVEAVEVALRHYFRGGNYETSFWAPAWELRGYFLGFVVVFVPALIVALGRRTWSHLSGLIRAAERYRWLPFLAAQVIAYSVFVLLIYQLSTRYQDLGDWAPAVATAWLLATLFTAAFALLSLAPKRFWIDFARIERRALLITGVLTIGTVASTLALRHWEWLGKATFWFSDSLLRLVYSDIHSNAQARELGTDAFQVTIARECSGYEGIVLVVAFLGLYLWLFRRDFRFPQTLIIFPVGILVIWTFNALRIATLIAIGTSVSPGIAEAGFHSNAGWIAFIIVTFALIWSLHRIPFFAATHATDTRARRSAPAPDRAPDQAPDQAADALLVPFLVMLAATIIVSALSAGFEWLYPLKVLATGAALGVFWRRYHFERWSPTAIPVAVGVLVFLGWVLLVPVSDPADATFSAGLSSVPTTVALLWLLFRCVGSAIVVPLAEELAFRGYLLSRLSGTPPTTDGRVPFNWVAFLLSSLAFGLFHDAWIAGTLAGMAYAYARYRRGTIGDAVLAHMTTNALLCGYAMLTGHWSYW